MVMYRKADGTRSSSSKGLHANTVSATGKALGAHAYKCELARVKRVAMQLWNALDASSAARYEIA